MSRLFVFTDGSVDVQTKIGYGASLVVAEINLAVENLVQKVETKRFENTSSTKLELQILLWALTGINSDEKKVIIYTDSQNITQLLERRHSLEQNDFRSKKGILLKNHELYKEFFLKIEALDCEIIKVKGHQPSRNKNEIERVFTLVDKASRRALREMR